ncbi:hypothetical protein PVAP13_8KG008500, partial [Panicum virgatum]
NKSGHGLFPLLLQQYCQHLRLPPLGGGALLTVSATRAEVTAAAAPVDLPLFPICKTVIGAGNPYFDINFCLAALNSDNESQYADDYQKLAIIAVDLLTANATSTSAQIGNLLKKQDNIEGPMRWCLQACQALYGSILQMQPRCSDLVKEFRYGEAKSCLDQAAREAEQCEAEFVRRHVASPLTVEDGCAFKLAKLASALLQHADD